MITKQIPCELRGCKYYRRPLGPGQDPTFTCLAFPKGIPEDVVSGKNLHLTPIEGDGGFQFAAVGKKGKEIEEMFSWSGATTCGVCGRLLTDPKSVMKGIGPVCEKHMGPGSHPSGSPQSVHAGRRGKKELKDVGQEGKAPKGTHGTGEDRGGRNAGSPPSAKGEINRKKAAEFLDDGVVEHIWDPEFELEGGWEDVSQETRAKVKQEIISELSKRSDISEEEMNGLVAQWAHSSNDDDTRSLALQNAAAEVFSIPESEFTNEKLRGVKASYESLTPQEKAREDLLGQRGLSHYHPIPTDNTKYLKVTYNYTQERLKAAGFSELDKITLYRGVALPIKQVSNWKQGDVIPTQGNVLESWSVGKAAARVFSTRRRKGHANIVLAMDVPVASIFSTARTGPGCLSEGEFIVVGSVGSEAKVEEIRRRS